MKTLFVVLAVTFSLNSFALEATKGVIAVSAIFTSTSSGVKPFGKAEEIIKEANEYYLNGGHASPYLAAQIRNLQTKMDISDDEAVDLLVETAKEILSLNY